MALERAQHIRRELAAEAWPTPLVLDSGNGAALLYRLDLPPQDDGLVKRTLEALALRHTGQELEIDTSVHNPARMVRLAGTLNRKGSNTPERPHRFARIVDVPEQFEVVSEKLLRALAADVPTNAIASLHAAPHNGPVGLDLERWIAEHHIELDGPVRWNGGRVWRFRACPWNPSHTNGSAVVGQLASGAIFAKCHHKSCSGKRWHDLRDVVEPGWREARQRSFEHRGAHDPRGSESTAELLANQGSEQRSDCNTPPDATIGYEPFPVGSLPGLLSEFISAIAEAVGCEVTLAALPCLPAIAGAIGNTRALQLKSSWLEPCVLWTAPVARSGGGKSPAFHHVLNPVAVYQAKALAVYREEHRKWEKAQERYEEALLDYKKHKGPKPGPPEEAEPRPVEFLVDDITTESLALKLRDNPRGLLGAPEELSGYFGGMDAYKKAHVDASRYLRMYDAKWMKIDRKTGDKADRIIFVRRAAVSLTGTIQTGILARCASDEHFTSGMMARFIIAQPPLARPEWSEATIPERLEDQVAALFAGLYALEGLREEGEEHLEEQDVQSIRPYAVYLTQQAKMCWVEFFNEFRFEEDPENLQQSALWAKTVGRAARLALFHHVVSELCAGRNATAPVQLESMAAGITIARWSLREGERIYNLLRKEARRVADGAGEEAPPLSAHAELVSWIASRGGTITPRDLQRGPRRYRGPGGDPEAVLQRLVDAGLGVWITNKPDAGPGRPARLFKLSPPRATGDTIHPTGDTIGEFPAENTYSVAVATSPEESAFQREPGDEPPETVEEVTWER